MKIEIVSEILLFLFLALLQVLLLSQINVFGYASPILYIYFLIKLPVNRNHHYVVSSAFLLGLVIDIFLNTPGMNAAAITIAAVFRNLMINKMFSKEEYEEYTPSILRETGKFFRYVVLIVLIHQLSLFFIDSFSLFNFLNTLIRIGSSSLLTVLLILSIDSLLSKK